MKKIMAATLLLAATTVTASDITLSRTIKSDLRKKIERDIGVIENFKFGATATAETLKVMGLTTLNAETATSWLNKRVSYVISENALSTYSLLVKRIIFVDQQNVDYPNANIIPYAIDKSVNLISASDEGFTVMSNIGTALYYGGKSERQIYGMKISRGLLKKAEKVAVTSPRTGIIQIGEGLFAPELTVNPKDESALSNSIFRLGTFFHEARHSDGNGKSLGFFHSLCPAGHDYAGQPACDENLNGPYTVGTLMMAEMAKACDEGCSEKDKQTLKLMVIDSANRVQAENRRGVKSTVWDDRPESL